MSPLPLSSLLPRPSLQYLLFNVDDTFTLNAQLDAQAGAPTEAHFTQSRALLDWLGGQGFPTLALEHAGRWTPLPVGQHLGRPEAFVAALQDALQPASGA